MLFLSYDSELNVKIRLMQRLISLARRARNYTNTHRIESLIGGGIFVATFLYITAFFVPQPVEFSYSGNNCVNRFTLLPDIHNSPDASRFDITFQKSIKVGSVNLVSLKTCVQPTSTPKEGTVVASTAPFALFVARSHLAVVVPSSPKINTSSLSKPFPVSKPLDVALTATDATFTYKLSVGDKVAACEPIKRAVRCDVPQLALKQDEEYKASVSREFKDSSTQLATMSVRTLKAISVLDGSVKPGQVVYDKPKTVTYTTDKAVQSAQVSLVQLEGETRKPIATKVAILDKLITISVANDFEREKKYELVIQTVEANDGSTLVEPYKASFEVSGGPKVKSVNIGSSRVSSNALVTLDFDQPLADSQPITQFIRFTGGGATVTKASPTRVTVALSNLPRCAPFSVDIAAGLKSNYDIATSAPWKFSSRTICYSLSTIGTSVRGRAINAYTFGNGGPTTLFVGALHGNEASSSLILQDWVNELESNNGRIPANSQVVVVPTVNPDGIAAGTRNNARNVNLNRNFPTNNWVKDIDDTNGKVVGGGGSEPLSEPEAKALANLSSSLRPRLMLSYHAVGSLVVGDPGGYSAGYAAKYASMVGYRNATGQSSSTFDYNITGSYEDWTIQNAGIPSMVVELGSYSYRNFGHHKEAFWAMLQ